MQWRQSWLQLGIPGRPRGIRRYRAIIGVRAACRLNLALGTPMYRLWIIVIILLGTAPTVKASPNEDSLPQGWSRSEPPIVVGFYPGATISAARKLMGLKKGAVALVPMNSSASEEDLVEIIEGLKDVRSRNEPVVCLSKDANLVSDAVGRALSKYNDVNLVGQRIVVAAPNRPPVEFLKLLHRRKLKYFYIKVEIKH